ncbi:MAG: cell division protein FtsQ [Bacillales bacterium]|nr:cell division protein FtsQ [Bacillales bacterium]
MVKKKINVVPIEKINPMVQEKRKIEAKKKLVNLLIVFFILALIIVYFQSDYSRVRALEINGTSITSNSEIIEWSGFKENDYFLKIRTGLMKEKLENHGEIKKVTFKRGFPNKLSVSVDEYKQFASLIVKGKNYPVLENGYVLKEETENSNSNLILQDFHVDDYLVDTVLELRKLPSDILLCISEVQYTPSEIDKNKLTLFMNDGMQVLVTISRISNLKFYPDYISNVPEGKKGLLDLEVANFFKPFDEIIEPIGSSEEGESQEKSDASNNNVSSNESNSNQNQENGNATNQYGNTENSGQSSNKPNTSQ